MHPLGRRGTPPLPPLISLRLRPDQANGKKGPLAAEERDPAGVLWEGRPLLPPMRKACGLLTASSYGGPEGKMSMVKVAVKALYSLLLVQLLAPLPRRNLTSPTLGRSFCLSDSMRCRPRRCSSNGQLCRALLPSG